MNWLPEIGIQPIELTEFFKKIIGYQNVINYPNFYFPGRSHQSHLG